MIIHECCNVRPIATHLLGSPASAVAHVRMALEPAKAQLTRLSVA